MNYKIRRDELGFSHLLVFCLVLVCITIGATGYRVSSTKNKSKVVSTATPKPIVKQTKATPELQQKATPNPAATQAPPISPQKKAPAAVPKPAPAFTTSIKINGSASCESSTKEALKLLSNSAPTHYSTVTTNISIVECAAQGS